MWWQWWVGLLKAGGMRIGRVAEPAAAGHVSVDLRSIISRAKSASSQERLDVPWVVGREPKRRRAGCPS